MGRHRVLRWGAALAVLAALAVAATVSIASATSGANAVVCGGVAPGRPAVSGGRVVWADYRKGQWDIWLYDGALRTARQITSGGGDKVDPAISGDTVLFTWYRGATGADIFAYDIPSGTLRALATGDGNQVAPTISGQWAAWVDYAQVSGGYGSRLMGFDLVNGVTPFRVFNLSGGADMQDSPSLCGNWVVWRESSNSRPDTDVWAYNFATAQRVRVTTDSYDDLLPVTDGATVVYATSGPGTGSDVWTYDLETGKAAPLAAAPGEQTLPAVGNGTAYWVDANRKQPLVIGRVLATGELQPLNTGAAITGFTANGDGRAWLQLVGDHWVVKALLGAPEASRLGASSALVPVGATWPTVKPPVLNVSQDSQAPEVVSTSVRPGERGVTSAKQLSVTFSEDMDPATVNSESVLLLSSRTGKAVTVNVAYSQLARAAVLTPSDPLDGGSYTLEVAPTVADTAGNAIGQGTAVSFSTDLGAPQNANPPSQVNGVSARVISPTQVQVTWLPASDDVAVTGYRIYRTPSATPSAPTLLVGTAGPSAVTTVVSVGTTEAAARFTLYYTVKATDDTTESQGYSLVVPCPHGTWALTAPWNNMLNTCLRCHQVHAGASGPGAAGGQFGKGSPALCYLCHGGTSPASAVGTNSITNVQAQFSDYDSAPLSGNASMHGNTYIRAQADDQQCDMCHTPHKRVYADDPTISKGSLLHRPAVVNTSTASVYNVDNAPFGSASLADRTAFCFACHGSGVSSSTAPLGYMSVNGGPTAYDSAGGDHNQANWANGTAAFPPTVPNQTAHGSYLLTDAARSAVAATMSPPNGGSSPSNDCQVCHNEHGSPGPALLGYRRSAPASDGAVMQSAMCFNCHTGGASADSGRAKRPNDTWNGRDVKAQFTNNDNSFTNTTGDDTWSHHVYSSGSRVYGSTVSDSVFSGYTLSNTVVTGGYVQLSAGQTSGNAVSGPISLSGVVNEWVSVVVTGVAPDATLLTVDVLDAGNNVIPLNPQWNGAAWVGSSPATMSAGQSSVMVPLVTVDPIVYPIIKVRVNFIGPTSATPQLGDVIVNYQSTSALSANSLTCYNCHNVHFVAVGGTSAWDSNRFSEPTDTNMTNPNQSVTDFCIGCHNVDAGSPTGMGARFTSAGRFVPYGVYFAASPNPTFPGWSKSAFYQSGHFTTNGTQALCQNCHDPHASNWQALLGWTTPSSDWITGSALASITGRSRDNTDTAAQESNLCFNCHGNGAVVGGYQGSTQTTGSNNVRLNVATPMAQSYGHTSTVIGLNDRHSDDETAGALIGVANRHAECVDCHNPHEAQPGTHTVGSSMAAPVLRGVYGVVPAYSAGTSWTAPVSWTTTAFAGQARGLEADLCLKCHGSYLPGWASNAPTSPSGKYRETDIALEFNPNNASGHSVLGSDSAGNTWPKAFTKNGSTWAVASSLSLGNGFKSTSKMTCSDCHSYSGTAARGPHGSSIKYMLKYGPAGTEWYTTRVSTWGTSSTFFCAGCHPSNSHGGWMNSESAHQDQCQTCHIRIPHGWKRPRLIAYHGGAGTADALPYSDPTVSGLSGIQLTNISDSGPSEGNCRTTCGQHGSASNPQW